MNAYCAFPDCTRPARPRARFCPAHVRRARAWLKEQRRLDLAGEQGLDAQLTFAPLEPGGPTYPWADWDWNSRFSAKPDDFGDWDEIAATH